MLVETCVRITTSQPHTDQKPTELLTVRSVDSNKLFLHQSCRRMVERSNGTLCPIIPFEASINVHPISSTNKSRLINLGQKVLSGRFIGYPLNSGGGWQGDVHRRELARHREIRRVRGSHRQVSIDQNSSHKETGNDLARSMVIEQEGNAQRQSKSSTQWEKTQVWARPWSDPLQSARCDSLHEQRGVADCSEADRGAMEAMGDFWSSSGEYI